MGRGSLWDTHSFRATPRCPAWASEGLGVKCFLPLLPASEELVLLTEDGRRHPQGLVSLVAWVAGCLITLGQNLCRTGRAGGEDSQLSLGACAVQVCVLCSLPCMPCVQTPAISLHVPVGQRTAGLGSTHTYPTLPVSPLPFSTDASWGLPTEGRVSHALVL